MNAAVTAADSPFRFFGAEAMFCEVMRGYFREYCSDEKLAERTRRLVAVTARRDGATAEGIRMFEVKIGQYLRDHPSRFEEIRKHFFFVDLCPEHSDRFNVSLDDCFSVCDESATAV